MDTKDTREITKALIAIQTKLSPLKANAKSHHGSFANLQQVFNTLQPHLEAQQIAVIQTPIGSSAGTCTLETRLHHQPSGQEIVSTITIPMQRQNDPQAYGAAMTYGRRYSLLCLFGMVTEDDDGSSASYTLERLLRDIASANDLNELGRIRDEHQRAGAVTDKFWSAVYNIFHARKYDSLTKESKDNVQPK